MRIVVDANILFSAIIKDSHTRRLLLNEKLSFLAPRYLLEELIEHKIEIEKKSGLSTKQVEQLLQGFLEIIEVVENESFKQAMKKALAICPDREDAPYITLCLYENTPLWSNDTKLKKQTAIGIYSTAELTEKLKENQDK